MTAMIIDERLDLTVIEALEFAPPCEMLRWKVATHSWDRCGKDALWLGHFACPAKCGTANWLNVCEECHGLIFGTAKDTQLGCTNCGYQYVLIDALTEIHKL